MDATQHRLLVESLLTEDFVHLVIGLLVAALTVSTVVALNNHEQSDHQAFVRHSVHGIHLRVVGPQQLLPTREVWGERVAIVREVDRGPREWRARWRVWL